MNIGVFSGWGGNIGGGHLVRCLRLIGYFHLTKKAIFFNHRHINAPYDDIQTQSVNWLDKEVFIATMQPFSHIIIDSYLASDWHYQAVLNAQKKLFIFDDLFLTYPLGAFVVNGSFSAESKMPSLAHYFFGSSYNLAPQIFNKPRLINDEIANVLVMFGSSDDKNYTKAVLECLNTSLNKQSIYFHIVLGVFNPHNIESAHSIYRNLDSGSLANLMAKCDVAICAAGQSLYEIALSKIPSLIFITADNQTFQARSLSQIGGIQITNLDTLYQDFSTLTFERRVQMSNTLAQLHIGTNIDKLWVFFSEF